MLTPRQFVLMLRLLSHAAQKKLNHHTVRRMPGMPLPREVRECQGAEFGPLSHQRGDYMFTC